MDKRYIPAWLAISGTLGLTLFFLLICIGGWLFITAEDPSEETQQHGADRLNPSITPPQAANSPAPTTPVPSSPSASVTTSPTPYTCVNALPPRLSIDSEAEVLTEGLRLRDAPGINTNNLLNTSQGERVTIIEGPRCVDNLTWWYVSRNIDGQTGWMTESSDIEYFLEPR